MSAYVGKRSHRGASQGALRYYKIHKKRSGTRAGSDRAPNIKTEQKCPAERLLYRNAYYECYITYIFLLFLAGGYQSHFGVTSSYGH